MFSAFWSRRSILLSGVDRQTPSCQDDEALRLFVFTPKSVRLRALAHPRNLCCLQGKRGSCLYSGCGHGMILPINCKSQRRNRIRCQTEPGKSLSRTLPSLYTCRQGKEHRGLSRHMQKYVLLDSKSAFSGERIIRGDKEGTQRTGIRRRPRHT